MIKSFAKKSNKSVQEVEKLWNKAKAIAKSEGKDENYAYITGILKKELGMNESIQDNTFYELFTEGMNQNKQKGMMNKDHFEKLMKKQGSYDIDGVEAEFDDGQWYLNGKPTKYTQVYQAYRAYYKGMNESSNIDDKAEQIAMLDGKGALVAWNWFEDNLGDSGIYAGDATPEDYLEIMSDKQIKELYRKIKRYI